MFNRLSLFIVLICFISCRDLQNIPFDNNQEQIVLLNMINKRLLLAPLVAKSKWNTKAPIDDYAREKVILDSVQKQAKKMGVDEKFARDFFQAQFEAGKTVQRELHKQWKVENHLPFDPVPNLTTEVRPVLDNLTPQLLIELKKLNPNYCNIQQLTKLRATARKVIHPTFNNQVVNEAIKPIEKYCISED